MLLLSLLRQDMNTGQWLQCVETLALTDYVYSVIYAVCTSGPEIK